MHHCVQFLCSDGAQPQVLVHARQALSPLSHAAAGSQDSFSLSLHLSPASDVAPGQDKDKVVPL